MARRFPFHLLNRLPPAGDHVPDAELLGRFARDRDPAALELVVRRHADAVWAACRRVSRTEADAEDAFQATFLVLARKAGAVRGASAGGWLHRVAVNAALKVRTRRATGVSPGNPVQDLADLAVGARPDIESAELASVVQEELARLPDRYRLPVVLCDLEGQTHAEAAKALRWPVGSVSGQLSRARGLLRDRLARRGYGPAAALIAPAGGLPPRLIPATTTTLSGAVPVPPPVSLIAEGVLSAMRTAKLQLTAAVVASAGLLGLAGAGTYTVLAQDRPPAAGPGGPGVAAPPMAEAKAGGDDGPYRKLLQEQWDLGRMEITRWQSVLEVGQFRTADINAVAECVADMRQIAAELYATDRNKQVAALEYLLGASKERERMMKARTEAGNDPPQLYEAARRQRLGIEAALWKAKNRPLPGGGPGR